MEEDVSTEVFDSITIKHGDVHINITADPQGILEGRTETEVLKFCADILLQSAEGNSLENAIDINIAIQDTLEKEFGWKKTEIFDFVRKLRKRLYAFQIGEESKTDDYKKVRQTAVEPSSDTEETVIEAEPEKVSRPRPQADTSNLAPVSIPLIPKEKKKEITVTEVESKTEVVATLEVVPKEEMEEVEPLETHIDPERNTFSVIEKDPEPEPTVPVKKKRGRKPKVK